MRLAIVVLAGCGRLGFDPQAASVPADAPPCMLGAWSTPRHQPALGSRGEDWEPAMSPDGLVLVFASTREGPMKLYAATRGSRTEDFAGLRFVDELSGGVAVVDHGPAWSTDGTRLYFVREPGGARVANHLGGGTFGTVTEVAYPGNNWAFSDDERELFYTAFDGDTDVRHARRENPTDPWVTDGLLDALDRDGAEEGWPSYDDARGELYLEQTVSGETVVRVAQRLDETFGALVTVEELGRDIGDPDISPDGREIAFGSGQPPTLGLNDIFLATRGCE